jgi:hypothetical protein
MKFQCKEGRKGILKSIIGDENLYSVDNLMGNRTANFVTLRNLFVKE